MKGKEGVKASEKEVIKVYSVLENYFPTWMGYNMANAADVLSMCQYA